MLAAAPIFCVGAKASLAARGIELGRGESVLLAATRESIPGEVEAARSVLLEPAFLSSTVGTGRPVPVTVSATATVPTLVAIDKVP
jgi:hypothetical protein